MITTSRFPHARFLMGRGGSRIIKSVNHHTGIETVYPARKSIRQVIGLGCLGVAGLSVVALVLVRVIHV